MSAQSNSKNKLGTSPKIQSPQSISSTTTNSRALMIDLSNRENVSKMYKDEYIPYGKVPNSWTGNTKSCNIGNNSKEYDDATLQNLRYYRAMAGVPSDVSFDEKYNKSARAAALIMEAKNNLSHTPPVSWPCYSKDGKDGAGASNLCLGCVGPDAIDAYVSDTNIQGVGHRVWALHPSQKVFGTGSSKRAHALYVFGDWRKSEEVSQIKSVAWPPKGFVPYKFGYNPDYPWSYQAFGSATNHKEAQVKMTMNGKSISFRKESGNSGILVWYPNGLTKPSKSNDYNKPNEDINILVEISNLTIDGKPQNFSYTVTFIDPEKKTIESSTESNATSDSNNSTATNSTESNSTNQSNTSNQEIVYDKEMSSALLSYAYDGDSKKAEDALKKKADPNISNNGWTPLMYASYFGHKSIVETLLKYKADPSRELDGWNAASLAKYQKYDDIVELLQSKSNNAKRSLSEMPKQRSLNIDVPKPKNIK
ncbi:MAG: hypothetical protein GW938_00145 [Leptospira sp.]|nr:hypothetical protein [Leptospira sp.]NCS95048.1 hypothetical protein [Leptospira sp.]